MEDKKKPDVARPEGMSELAEQEINVKLDRMVTLAKKDKAMVAGTGASRWEKFADFYVGNHWKGYAGALDLHMVHNRIRENIETVNALVNEMRITAEFQPREPNDEITSELMNAGLRYGIETQNVLETEGRIGKTALILGTGIGKVYWDPDAAGGKGDWVVAQVPPQDFYMEAGSTSIETARYVFYERFMDPKEVETKYGYKAKADSDHEDTMFDLEDNEAGGTSGVKAAMSFDAVQYPDAPADYTASLVPADSFISGGESNERVLVQEFFIREDDTKKWPGGRMIVRAGKHVVEDRANPYEHGMWPYYMFICEEDPKRAWGDTFMRHAIPLQKEMNIVASVITLNSHLGTSTGWFNYANSGVSNEYLQTYGSTAGAIIPVSRPGFEPKRMPPIALNGSLFEWYDRLGQSIDEQMRVQKVVPPGARGYPASGEVIEQLRESQLVNVRQIASYRARGVRRRTKMIGALMQQFYAADRYARILGPLPAALEGLKDPNDESKDVVITSQNPNGDKRDVHYVQMNPDNMKGNYDTVVVESTWEPLSKKAQIDMLLDMNERDPETVPISTILELMDRSPVIERLIRKNREAEAAAAEAPPAEPPMDPMAMGGMPPADPMGMQGPMQGPLPPGPPMNPMGGM